MTVPPRHGNGLSSAGSKRGGEGIRTVWLMLKAHTASMHHSAALCVPKSMPVMFTTMRFVPRRGQCSKKIAGAPRGAGGVAALGLSGCRGQARVLFLRGLCCAGDVLCGCASVTRVNARRQ